MVEGDMIDNFLRIAAVWTRMPKSSGMPDVPFKWLHVNGVKVLSRYGKLDEYTAMVRGVRAIPLGLRAFVVSILCDSKAQFSYAVELDSPNAAHAREIGDALSKSFLGGIDGLAGHNGIWIRHGDDLLLEIPADYNE